MASSFRGRATGSIAETADAEMVRRALRLLADPGASIEIRVLPYGRSRTFSGKDIDGAAAFVAGQDSYTGIYYALNPVALGTTATVGNVLSRRWLLVDIDATNKPADVSSTEQEHDEARSVANNVVSGLSALGWPLPILIDSGNGWHCLYRIDVENSNLSRELVKRVLDEIGKRFDRPAARVDRKVFDAPRIAKLPGTWARKGPNTTDRPHRLCRIVSAPDMPQIVDIGLLQTLVGGQKEQPPSTNGSPFKGRASSDNRNLNYARTAFQKELAELATCPEGARNDTLNKAAFAAGQFVAAGVLLREHVEAELQTVAERVGLPTHEAQRTIKSGLDAGVKEPRKLPEDSAKTSHQKPVETEWEGIVDGEVITIDKDTVAAEAQLRRVRSVELFSLHGLMSAEFPPVKWAVPGILSEGLNILGGKPKQGKSMFALNLGMTIAAGGEALKSIRTTPGDVLYLSLEDKQRRLQFRARSMLRGLEVEATKRLQIAVTWPRQREGGLHLVRWWAGRVERPTLIIIDVWGRFRPPSQQRGNQYEQDYDAMAEIKQLVDEIGCTALVLHHCRKGSKGTVEDVLEEISGTMGLSGAADGIIVLSRSRGDREAILHITGRDVQDTQLALEFDKETLTWKSMGDAEQHVSGQLTVKIVNYLRGLGGQPASVPDISTAIDHDAEKVRRLLYKMRDKGMVRKVGQSWAWPAAGEPDDPVEWTR